MLVYGNELTPSVRAEVLRLFVHRFTKDHIPAWAKGTRDGLSPYPVQSYEYDAPGYNIILRCSSRRKASRVFGQLRSNFPGSIVTLNRREYFGDGIWLTTTHHWKG